MFRELYQGSGLGRIVLYQCAGISRYTYRTTFVWLQPNEFPKFDTIGFKEVSLHPMTYLDTDKRLMAVEARGRATTDECPTAMPRDFFLQ